MKNEYSNMPKFQDSKDFAKGWFWKSEGEWYEKIANSIKNGKIIEIGSFEGLSLSYIKHTILNNNNKIWCVEPFLRKKLVDNAKEWGIEIINESSEIASKRFPDNFFDLVFIDANHSYENVKLDINLWLPKVKNKGILAGHDYHSGWPGVIKAVDELLPSKKINNRNWFIKKKEIKFL